MPTLAELANELGIDPAVLSAKGDVVTKWNGYLSGADTKYQDATRAQKEAVDKLEQAKREQQVINEQIAKFGMDEARMIELETAIAVRDAALAKVKASGLNVDMSGFPPPTASTPPDPTKALTDKVTQGFSLYAQALKTQNTYQNIFGKPFSDDIEALSNEAQQNRMSLFDYAAKKYDFTGEQSKRQKAAQEAHDADVSAKAVSKYREDHPEIPLGQRGVASRHPQIVKPRDAQTDKTFRNLPAKERIAQSVARSRAALAGSGDAA